MDRNSFYYLFVNSNSIAELAMQLMAERVMAQPLEPEEPMTQEEYEAQMAARFKDVDLAALQNEDGDFDVSRYFAAQAASNNEADVPHEPPPLPELTPEQEAAREVSIGTYLATAYVQEASLLEAVAQCYQQLDLPALAAAVAQLPADLPPMTEALSAPAMARWLRLYEADDEAVNEVVLQFRRWVMSAADSM